MGAPLGGSLSMPQLGSRSHVRRQPRIRLPCLGYRYMRPGGSIGHEIFANSREKRLQSNSERENQRLSAPQELQEAVLAHVKACNLNTTLLSDLAGSSERPAKSGQSSPDFNRHRKKKATTHGSTLQGDRYLFAAYKKEISLALQEQACLALRTREQARFFEVMRDQESLRTLGVKAARSMGGPPQDQRHTQMAAVAEVAQKLQEMNATEVPHNAAPERAAAES